MKAGAKSFQDLLVWRKHTSGCSASIEHRWLCLKHELYGLTSQLRRAAVSVPANIAEGFKRRSKNDKARMLNIAQASLEETRYHLILSRDLEYLEVTQLITALDEVSRMLDGYVQKLLSPDF